MRKLRLFLVLVGCLAVVPAAMAVDCPDGKKEVVKVTVTVGSNGITVDPETAEIWLETASRPEGKPIRACWVVQGLGQGRTLHIGAKDSAPGLLSASKYEVKSTTNHKSTSTGTARDTGNWGYSVWVTRTGQETPILWVDPVIIINEGMGGGGRP